MLDKTCDCSKHECVGTWPIRQCKLRIKQNGVKTDLQQSKEAAVKVKPIQQDYEEGPMEFDVDPDLLAHIKKSLDADDYIKESTATIPGKNTVKSNKYMREILSGVWIDVYDVLKAFEVTDQALGHALKKMLAVGKRGLKDEAEDRKDILASILRSNEIYERKLK